jgi:hypothetical protein
MSVRRPCPIRLLLAVSLAGLAALSGGCGSSVSQSATPAPGASPTPTAALSASASASPSALATESPTPGLGLPHVNVALEDLLPKTIGGIELQKMSIPLSTYVASSGGGDKALLGPWAVHFGKTPDDVDMAIATDLTQQESFFVQAIRIPGAKSSDLTGEFATLARADGWPVTGRVVASRAVLEITDPAAEAAGQLATAYVLANDDVMYVVVTDDTALLLEALIKLPGQKT